MENCLVTALKGSVDNSLLRRLNAVNVIWDLKSVDAENIAQEESYFTIKMTNYLHIISDNECLSTDLSTWSNSIEVNGTFNGNIYIKKMEKPHIVSIMLDNPNSYFNIFDPRYGIVCSDDLLNVITKYPGIVKFGNTYPLYGSFSNLKYFEPVFYSQTFDQQILGPTVIPTFIYDFDNSIDLMLFSKFVNATGICLTWMTGVEKVKTEDFFVSMYNYGRTSKTVTVRFPNGCMFNNLAATHNLKAVFDGTAEATISVYGTEGEFLNVLIATYNSNSNTWSYNI